jgi:hypothetical protein
MDKPKLTLDEILDIVLPMIKQNEIEVPSFKDWVSNVRKDIKREPFYKGGRYRPWGGDNNAIEKE